MGLRMACGGGSLLPLLHSQIQCMPHAQACRSLCSQMLEDLPGTDSTAQARKLGQSSMSTGCCVTAHECSSTWIKPAVQMEPRNKDTDIIKHLAQHSGRCAALQRLGCRVVRCYRGKMKQRRTKGLAVQGCLHFAAWGPRGGRNSAKFWVSGIGASGPENL